MERKEITNEYKVSENGIIQDPGKFEGEMLYALHFYDALMNGCGDETLSNGDELFEVSDDDRAMFPELGTTKFVVVHETDQGFITLEEYDEDEDPRDFEHSENMEFSEPEEDDITTEDHLHFYQSGKPWLTLTEDDDMNAAVNAQMERDSFWPNVWFISDHGNAHLIEL